MKAIEQATILFWRKKGVAGGAGIKYCFKRESRTSEAEFRTGDVLSWFGPGQPFGGVSSMVVMALGTASTGGMTFDRWLARGHRYKSICYSDATAVLGALGDDPSRTFFNRIESPLLSLCDEVIIERNTGLYFDLH